MRRVCITGVAGQIGNHLGRYLRLAGYGVIGIDIREPSVDACDAFSKIDIVTQYDDLILTLRQHSCSDLIHLADRKSVV